MERNNHPNLDIRDADDTGQVLIAGIYLCIRISIYRKPVKSFYQKEYPKLAYAQNYHPKP